MTLPTPTPEWVNLAAREGVPAILSLIAGTLPPNTQVKALPPGTLTKALAGIIAKHVPVPPPPPPPPPPMLTPVPVPVPPVAPVATREEMVVAPPPIPIVVEAQDHAAASIYAVSRESILAIVSSEKLRIRQLAERLQQPEPIIRSIIETAGSGMVISKPGWVQTV